MNFEQKQSDWQVENEIAVEKNTVIVEDEKEKDIDAKKFSEVVILDMESGQKDLESKGMQEFDRLANEIQAKGAVSEKYKKSLDEISEKAKGLFIEAKRRVQQLVIGMSMIGATTASAESDLLNGYVEKISSSDAQEKIVQSPDDVIAKAINGTRVKKENESLREKIEKIEQSLMTDTNEKILLSFEKNGKVQFIESDGEANFGNVSFEELDKALKDGASKIEITHTHPLSVSIQSPDKIEKIKSGEISPNPMPPSMVDYNSLISEAIYFKSDSEKIGNRIVDPSGEWKMSLQKNNEFFKKYVGLMNWTEKFSDIEFLRAEMDITPEQAEILKGMDELSKMHPEAVLPYLKSDSKTNEIAQIIEKKYLEKMKDIFSEKELEKIEKVFGNGKGSLMMQIMNYEKKDSNIEREILIAKYISSARELGMETSFTHSENFDMESASQIVEDVRSELITHIESSEYLAKLVIEFGGKEKEAKFEQERRLENVKKVRVFVATFEGVKKRFEEISGVPIKDDTITGGFYDPKTHKIYVNHHDKKATEHELLHASIRTAMAVPDSTIEELDSSYIKQGFLNLFENDEDEYYRDSSERMVRKQMLDRELEKLGIKKYGERFTENHYQLMRKAYDEGKFSINPNDFIKRTKKGNFVKIFNDIASNSLEKSQVNV